MIHGPSCYIILENGRICYIGLKNNEPKVVKVVVVAVIALQNAARTDAVSIYHNLYNRIRHFPRSVRCVVSVGIQLIECIQH